MKLIDNIISFLYQILFFFVPLAFFHKTSELFEFNKIILTYVLVVLIVVFWIIKMIAGGKFIFRRSVMDIPLVLFLIFQTLSTFLSIDFRTSLLGYYSRFHGGLMSTVSYSLLYWAFVSNLNRNSVKKTLYALIGSSIIVCSYAILQHFGIDEHIWIQDVRTRVFSTFGQPNWLAAWIVAIIPLSFLFLTKSTLNINSRFSFLKIAAFAIYMGVLYIALLYTKSKSGILAFAVVAPIFWTLTLTLNLRNYKNILLSLLISSLIIGGLTLAERPTWATSLFNGNDETQNQQFVGPALEVGGTDSGEIRKIVWRGAIDIWKNYPLFGSGVETFAFSYYLFRPVEHNMVSEWDFLYNKAHNEYLNFAATSGTAGLVSYLILILSILFLLVKNLFKINFPLDLSRIKNFKATVNQSVHGIRYKNSVIINASLLAGFISLLITNFFGFSVVPTALIFFLFPAISIANGFKQPKYKGSKNLNQVKLIQIFLVLAIGIGTTAAIFKYWLADYNFNYAQSYNLSGNPVKAREFIEKAVQYSPNEAIFWTEYAEIDASLSIEYHRQNDYELSMAFAQEAISFLNKAETMSPSNLNIKRKKAVTMLKLTEININYLIEARNTLIRASELAPTDAKIYYNLGVAYIRTGENENAYTALKKAVEFKPNYRDPHLALALLYESDGELEKAKEYYNFILDNISPDDEYVRTQLEILK
jgi:putative inorganic carbon (hco3(-)) transporter